MGLVIMTDDIVAFLRARLAEDEAAAKAASPGGWQYSTVESVGGGALYDETRTIASLVYEQPEDHDGQIVRHLLSGEANRNGAHIARHDPARVLADVEAKRRIVEDAAKAIERARDGAAFGFEEGVTRGIGIAYEEEILPVLAQPYAGHPDWREEWRV